jgi:hypothetical protein
VPFEKMINEGGVCSDFAQIYNNFCVIRRADLKVKRRMGLTKF